MTNHTPETRLRVHIDDSDRSLKDLARATGISYAKLWRWTRGGEATMTLNDGVRLWEEVTGNPVKLTP